MTMAKHDSRCIMQAGHTPAEAAIVPTQRCHPGAAACHSSCSSRLAMVGQSRLRRAASAATLLLDGSFFSMKTLRGSGPYAPNRLRST